MHHQNGQRGEQLYAVVAVGYAVERVVGQARKAELLTDEVAVDRIGGGSERARAERHLVHTLVAVLETGDVALQHIGICHHIMCERRRLRTLKMRIARHDSVQILAALLGERLHEAEDQLDDLLDLLLDIQTHIERDLIVSRTAGMQALAGIADALGEQLLDVHMNVLIIERELYVAFLDILENALEALNDLLGLVLLDDALPAQHGRVRDRAGDVLLVQTAVKQDGRVKVVYYKIGLLLETSCP